MSAAIGIRRLLRPALLSARPIAALQGLVHSPIVTAKASLFSTALGSAVPQRGLTTSTRCLASIQTSCGLKLSNDDDNAPPAAGGGDGEGGASSVPPSSSGSSDDDGAPSDDSPPGDVREVFDALKRAASILENTLQRPTIPTEYPTLLALPIARRPLFPGFYKAVVVKNPAVVAAIKELVKRGQPYIGTFLLKDDGADTDIINGVDDVYRVGTFAQITNMVPTQVETPPGGVSPASSSLEPKEESLTVVLYPHRRIRMNALIAPKLLGYGADDVVEMQAPSMATIEPAEEVSELATTETPAVEDSAETEAEAASEPIHESPAAYIASAYPVSVARVHNIHDEPHSKSNQLIRAITSEMVAVFKDLANMNPLFREQVTNFSMRMSAGNPFEEPGRLADFAAAVSAGEPSELQSVLDSAVIEERMQKALLVLKKELMNAQLQSKIRGEVEAKIQKRQREYYLMEQLKGIKKELGLESDGKDKLIEGFHEKAKKLDMPEAVKTVFDEEISKLAHLEPQSAEFSVTRNYLDWITQVPWGVRSAENYSIPHAQNVLDEDHYGLKDVKERILEFIAVGKLRGTVQGKIICLVGPPGVGKTSIGKSIARALSREFYRFSVGGLTDVAEIKGHRRTYVGAMPGKVIQALKKVQTENPLVLIDEIDKVGRGHQGDPSSALLELLDPEQNSSFLDHYMDVPVDLSRVLFVCTANVLDTIPGPLLDRMEVIQLSGYIAEEKVAIAQNYLIPQAAKDCGVADAGVQLTKEAVEALIRGYCRESGVRNLKKHIEKVFRKAAFRLVEKDSEESAPEIQKHSTEASGGHALEIGPDNLKDYVGPAVYTSDRLYETTPPGVVMGLAWTGQGGSALYVESILESPITDSSKASLTTTGQMGDVMKESTSIAYSYVKGYMTRKHPENAYFDKASIHLHVPEGATPKDGPSAGITMASSLLSLALGRSLPPTMAMTGELTLTGRVLRIGGLKEKVIAAKRSGVNTVLYPESNQADWEELPDHVKEGVEGKPVAWFDDIPSILGLE